MMATVQGNKRGRHCVGQRMSCAISTEFGMKLLELKFPGQKDAVLVAAGTFQRGPRKGLPKGYIHWEKISEGGWDYSAHCVRYKGSFGWCIRADRDYMSPLLQWNKAK